MAVFLVVVPAVVVAPLAVGSIAMDRVYNLNI